MPKKKAQPTKDIYLAGKLLGVALQINTDVLEKYLNDTPDDIFHYKDDCRRVLEFCKAVKNHN